MSNFQYLWLSLILTIFTSTNGQSDFDWDYIIFSQRWPLTTCTEWEETKSGNVCNLPTNKLTWTIHGIWPTKTGTKGPLFCKSAIHFDPNEVTPILDDLKEHWTNVEANTKPYSFWEHEWKKHGTCASILPQFDSVTNYFTIGINLNKNYNLSAILESHGVVPNTNGYNLQDIYNIIKNSTGKEPNIQCITDKNTKESFMSEIRLCFNKTLDLIDCESSSADMRSGVRMNTNCNLKKSIMYLPSIPQNYLNKKELEMNEIDQSIQNWKYYTMIYNFLNILFWITL